MVRPELTQGAQRVRVVNDVADTEVFKQNVDGVSAIINPALELGFNWHGGNPRLSELLDGMAVTNDPNVMQNQGLETRVHVYIDLPSLTHTRGSQGTRHETAVGFMPSGPHIHLRIVEQEVSAAFDIFGWRRAFKSRSDRLNPSRCRSDAIDCAASVARGHRSAGTDAERYEHQTQPVPFVRAYE